MESIEKIACNKPDIKLVDRIQKHTEGSFYDMWSNFRNLSHMTISGLDEILYKS